MRGYLLPTVLVSPQAWALSDWGASANICLRISRQACPWQGAGVTAMIRSRVVCVNGDLWQSHVADLFPGGQHKSGASRDA